MDDAPIMIAPGKNQVLHYIARQMEGLADVQVLGSANQLLWQARQTPPRLVLTDVQLEDMSGAELAEILPNFAPNTRILVCGQSQPTVVAQVQSVGAEFVAIDGPTAQAVETVYRALDMAPPPVLPSTSELTLPPIATAPPRPAPPAVAPKAEAQAPRATPVTPNVVSAGQAAPAKPVQRPEQSVPQPRSAPAGETGRNGAQADQGKVPMSEAFAASGSFVIQPQQHQVLTRLLDLVAKEVGAQCVLLSDMAGMVLVQAGVLPGVVLEMVGPLLATSFSTTGQLARLLQEQNAHASYVHEGDRYDIYAFNVGYRVSLIIMFDKRINPGKLGTVWVYAKRAMRQLEQILKL